MGVTISFEDKWLEHDTSNDNQSKISFKNQTLLYKLTITLFQKTKSVELDQNNNQIIFWRSENVRTIRTKVEIFGVTDTEFTGNIRNNGFGSMSGTYKNNRIAFSSNGIKFFGEFKSRELIKGVICQNTPNTKISGMFDAEYFKN